MEQKLVSFTLPDNHVDKDSTQWRTVTAKCPSCRIGGRGTCLLPHRGCHPWRFLDHHPWLLWDRDGAVGCAQYAQLVTRDKELLEICNSLKLGDASWRQCIRESSSHDLEAVDDFVFC